MAVLFEGKVFLFKFKVGELESEGKAMEKLLAKNYVEKYQDRGKPIFLIGVEFSREKRNLVGFEKRGIESGKQ